MRLMFTVITPPVGEGGRSHGQRRLNGAVDFYRGLDDYKKGFGLVDGEFWLGLDQAHRLTNQTVNELHVDLEDFSQAKAYAAYDLFKVENQSKNYELKLGLLSGKSLKMTSSQPPCYRKLILLKCFTERNGNR